MTHHCFYQLRIHQVHLMPTMVDNLGKYRKISYKEKLFINNNKVFPEIAYGHSYSLSTTHLLLIGY